MFRKKLLVSALLGASVVASSVQAADYGKVGGYVRMMHIIDGVDNNFDPSTGSAVGYKLKYTSPTWQNLHLGLAAYGVYDTGLTDEDQKIAHGIFLDGTPKTVDGKSFLGEAYLGYTSSCQCTTFNIGRMDLKTPMTQNKVSLVPNLFEAAVLSTEAVIVDTTLILAHVEKMSFGSRSMADGGLIGEYTGTAGALKPPMGDRGDFQDIETVAGMKTSTNGITTLAAINTSIPNTTVALWDYYAHDILNIIYGQVDHKIKLKGIGGLTLSGQYLHEGDIGDFADHSSDMFGVKASLGNKKYGAIYAAYNHSGDEATINPWGGDPAFTSSIFSRNAYRADVDAWKIGGKYKILKNLIVSTSYADYGQSTTTGFQKTATGLKPLTPTTDATEVDLVIVYKPLKALTLKLMAAQRVSEYDGFTLGGSVKDYEQEHLRLIVNYKYGSKLANLFN